MGIFSLFRRDSEIKNPDLVRAMYAVVDTDSPRTRRLLHQEMVDSTLILAVTSMAEAKRGLRRKASEAEFPFFIQQDEEEQYWLSTFSDLVAMRNWREKGYEAITMDLEKIIDLVQQSACAGIAINPAGPVGVKMPAAELAGLPNEDFSTPLEEFKQEIRMPDGTSIVVSTPMTQLPADLLNVLYDRLASHKEVTAAYAFNMAINDNPPRLAIGLLICEMPAANRLDAIMQDLVRRVTQTVGEEFAVDFCVIQADTEMYTALLRIGLPGFYTG